MEKLEEILEVYKKNLPQDAQQLIKDDTLKACSKYPFNRYANLFSVFLNNGTLTYERFTEIRTEYFERNPYLDLFEKAPRSFGQTWGEEWLTKQNIGLIKSTNNQYDLWLPLQNNKGIRIEVKSSHVADKDTDRILIEKALKKPRGTEEEISNTIKKLSFKMNFQQLKPSCCDVFIWIAAWLDDIDIWVIPSSKIVMRPKNAPRRKPKDSIVLPDGKLYMGTQHQGGKGGKVPEGQIFVTNNHYNDLQKYRASLDTLIEKIKAANKNGNIN